MATVGVCRVHLVLLMVATVGVCRVHLVLLMVATVGVCRVLLMVATVEASHPLWQNVGTSSLFRTVNTCTAIVGTCCLFFVLSTDGYRGYAMSLVL